jgi:hypothetical protein
MEQPDRRIRGWVLLFVAAFVVTGIAIVWGDAQLRRPAEPPVSETAAVSRAGAFLIGMQPSGVTVGEIHLDEVDLERDGNGRPVWTVRISGDVIEDGETTPTYASHLWLQVDGTTGEVTLIGQG